MFIKRLLTASALMLVGATSAVHAQAPAFTDEQIKALGPLIREYIIANPDVIAEANTLLEQIEIDEELAATKEAIKRNADAIYDSPGSPVSGNPDGDVTIVEFFDYRCEYCKALRPELARLVKEDGNIKLVFKELPMLGEASLLASELVLAARLQDPNNYEAFHDELMSIPGDITPDIVIRLAKSKGYDTDQMEADRANPEVVSEIDQNFGLAGELGLSGTPAFIFGDEFLPGALPYEVMVDAVDRVRQARADAQ